MKGKDKVFDDFEISFYEGIVKRSPHYIEALIPLAEAYTKQGLYDKGLEIDQRLSKLCHNDPIIFYNLACSLNLVGQEREALKNLKKAIALGYDDFGHMKKDQDLKSLWRNPAFLKLFPAEKRAR